MAKSGADFHLSDEIMSVIPTDPFDQLDLARKITSMAIASRVTQLEAENGILRKKIVDKDQVIADLHDRLSDLNRLFQESDSQLKLSLDENFRLAKERDTLALTAKKLSRDLTKLESFKRQLMLSLNDDSPSQGEGEDTGTSDLSVARISAWKDQSSHSHNSSDAGSSKMEESKENGTKAAGNKFSITPYITPHISPHMSPNTTPRVSSTGGSPRGFSTADSSPKFSSGTTSPTKFRFEDQNSMGPWYPSSQQTSAVSSPPRVHPLQARTSQIDGKEFFRQARTRLSYEQFGSFLANIKELNAQRKSRQETLAMAEEIFGTENKDLYLLFHRLLNRN